MKHYLPDTPSWEIAAGAMAMDSASGEVTEGEVLLEIALKDAGTAILMAGTEGSGEHIVITPVEWRSAPWLGRYRRDHYDIDVFLFEDRHDAEEWARLLIQELADEDGE